MKKQKRNTSKSRRPWGRFVAMMVACAVTLTGVACGVGPETILKRAVVASVGIGLLVAGATRFGEVILLGERSSVSNWGKQRK